MSLEMYQPLLQQHVAYAAEQRNLVFPRKNRAVSVVANWSAIRGEHEAFRRREINGQATSGRWMEEVGAKRYLAIAK
jgi:hypothetical protein